MVCISRPPVEQNDDVDGNGTLSLGSFAGSSNDVNANNIVKMTKDVHDQMRDRHAHLYFPEYQPTVGIGG